MGRRHRVREAGCLAVAGVLVGTLLLAAGGAGAAVRSAAGAGGAGGAGVTVRFAVRAGGAGGAGWTGGAVVHGAVVHGAVVRGAVVRGAAVREAAVREAAGSPGPDAVTAFGAAAGAVPARSFGRLSAGLVGVAPTTDGAGYWAVAADGGVFPTGAAGYFGSLGATRLNAPVVGIAATPDGGGYWLAASDGGIFPFGDAHFYGSLGATRLNAPVVGIAATPDGGGYWLAASDGGIFPFGDAHFYGSLGATRLNRPVTGIAAAGAGGYWLVAADGGVFTFGNAAFEGSDGGTAHGGEAVGIAGRAGGYWLAYGADPAASIVAAIGALAATRIDDVTVAVDDLTTGQIIQYRPGVVEHTASTLKVDILATLLARAQAQGRTLTPVEQSLAVPMIEESLDSAADTLWGELGPAAVGAVERAAGMTSTVPATDGIWGATTTTALDRVAMVRAVAEANPVLTNGSRAYLLDLMEHVTPSQDWGATGGVPADVTVALKNGFAVIDGWQINTEGWVSGDGRDYLIGVLTDANPSEAYGIATVNAVSSIVWNALGG